MLNNLVINAVEFVIGGRGDIHKRELLKDSTIESSYDSPSQTDNSMSPYARVKREHPYDQVKQSKFGQLTKCFLLHFSLVQIIF